MVRLSQICNAALAIHVKVCTRHRCNPALAQLGECWGKYSNRALSDSRTMTYCRGGRAMRFLAPVPRPRRSTSKPRQSRVLDPPRQRDATRCRATGDGGPTTSDAQKRSGDSAGKRSLPSAPAQRALLLPCTWTEPPILTQVLVPGSCTKPGP
jgi:hypothetical protein